MNASAKEAARRRVSIPNSGEICCINFGTNPTEVRGARREWGGPFTLYGSISGEQGGRLVSRTNGIRSRALRSRSILADPRSPNAENTEFKSQIPREPSPVRAGGPARGYCSLVRNRRRLDVFGAGRSGQRIAPVHNLACREP